MGTRIACGLVAGSALMDVLLAIPFSLQHSADAWRIVSDSWEQSIGVILSIVIMLGLGIWIIQRVEKAKI